MQINTLLNMPLVFLSANRRNPKKKWQKEGTYNDLSKMKGEIKMTENHILKTNKIIKKIRDKNVTDPH